MQHQCGQPIGNDVLALQSSRVMAGLGSWAGWGCLWRERMAVLLMESKTYASHCLPGIPFQLLQRQIYQSKYCSFSRPSQQCFLLALFHIVFRELFSWLSQNLWKESSVINFTLLFNVGNLCIVPAQCKPGSLTWQCCCCVQETQSAKKPIVLHLDKFNAQHQSFAKLGCTLGNLPSLVTNATSKLSWAGSASP